MTTLAGTIVTYDGDPNEMFLVTTDSVVNSAQETDPDIANFLRASVGTGCPGSYVSAADIILQAQEAGDEIVSGGDYIPPCTWLKRYAPFLLAADFQQTGIEVDFNSGTWLLSATFLHLSRERVFPIPSNNCWETIDTPRSFYWHGPRPQIVGAVLNEPYCFYPQGASNFSANGGIFGSPSGGERDFKNGSATIVLVEPDTNRVTRDNLIGTPFMPIPPIPAGYPAPPNAPPPLTGGAVLDALSDDDCHSICQRGEAFLTWWDIGNRSFNQDEGEREWLQTKTETLGDLNTDEMQPIVTNATDEVLTQTAQIVLGKVLDRVVDAGKVVIKSGGANKILTILGPAGKIIQTVEIASELIQEVQMLLQQLYIPQCLGSDRPNVVGTLSMVPIPFPVQTLDGVSQLSAFQAIADCLFMLLKCCPPCVTDIWHLGPTFSETTKWFPEFTFSEVLFETIEAKSPSHIAMGGQEKLGWFKWIEQQDGNPELHDINKPIWVNGNLAVFRPDNNFTKGLLWMPQNGVTVRLYYKFAPQEWEMNRFLAPPVP